METVQESSGRLLFAKKQEIIEAELRGATQNGICIKNREKNVLSRSWRREKLENYWLPVRCKGNRTQKNRISTLPTHECSLKGVFQSPPSTYSTDYCIDLFSSHKRSEKFARKVPEKDEKCPQVLFQVQFLLVLAIFS